MKIFKNYWAPTPKGARAIGDALLWLSGILATGAVIQFDELQAIFTPKEIKIAIVICILSGVVGKAITNFFAVPSGNNEPKE